MKELTDVLKYKYFSSCQKENHMSGMWIVLIAAIILGFYLMNLYNTLVRMRNAVKEAWSDIEVQLKRRFDLIPNLLSTVKGYKEYESTTLEKVIAARNVAFSQPHTVQEVAKAEGELSGALKSLFALSENYPDLKANTNFLELQRELRDTEDKIQAARRFYNGNVLAFNTKIQQFPANMIAEKFQFEEQPLFELAADEQAAKQPVKVEF